MSVSFREVVFWVTNAVLLSGVVGAAFFALRSTLSLTRWLRLERPEKWRQLTDLGWLGHSQLIPFHRLLRFLATSDTADETLHEKKQALRTWLRRLLVLLLSLFAYGIGSLIMFDPTF